jgi:hypothetical protein
MRIRLVAVVLALLATGSAAPGQTPATGTLMREKLTHAERVLEAIMVSDYLMLQRHSQELARATQSPAWQVFKSPEYIRYSEDFLRAAQDLVNAAEQRDLDAAAFDYVTLTVSCYDCHRYIKRARLAK